LVLLRVSLVEPKVWVIR